MFAGFWSGVGRFVLKSLDVGLRTNRGTSAREFISFCKIANLPSLSFDALTAPTAFYEKSHGNAATEQPFPSLKAWHVESPGADQLLGANTKGSRVPLSPLVWFSAALLSVVSDTRVQTA